MGSIEATGVPVISAASAAATVPATSTAPVPATAPVAATSTNIGEYGLFQRAADRSINEIGYRTTYIWQQQLWHKLWRPEPYRKSSVRRDRRRLPMDDASAFKVEVW